MRVGESLVVTYLLLWLLVGIMVLGPNDSFAASRGVKFLGINNLSTVKRVALVIGNSDYQQVSPLNNPINDAQAIKRVLTDLDFEVMYSENASFEAMQHMVNQFGRYLNLNKGVGLFYYAGHGIQVAGENYLIPVDAAINDFSLISEQSVSLSMILKQMENAHNPFNMVILDACRNNPFNQKYRSITRGLAKIDAPKGTLVAYATGPGKLAADGFAQQNSVYTKHLLVNLIKPNLAVEQMFKLVRKGVIKDTNSRQVPWESSSLTGDFYFSVKTNQSASVTKPNPEATPPQPNKTNINNKLDSNSQCDIADKSKRPISCLFGENKLEKQSEK